MDECWKDIPGYEGKYQASDQGNIRSLTRQITQIGRWGTLFTRTVPGRVLRPASSKYAPHLYVVLGRHKITKETVSFPVHQLVAQAFISLKPADQEVRHLNGNAQDNRPVNLCYGSRTDNILDVLRIGRAWRKLTWAQARQIKDRLANGEMGRQIAKDFDVSETTVSSIKVGRIHKNA